MAMSVTYTTFNGQIAYENRNGTQSFYAPDTLGSTAMLLDTTGTVTDTFTYWPYGEIQEHVGSSVTPFTFVGTLGYYLDIAGSLTYIRARHYLQALCRWLTVDPLWPWRVPLGTAITRLSSSWIPRGARASFSTQVIPPSHRCCRCLVAVPKTYGIGASQRQALRAAGHIGNCAREPTRRNAV